MDGAMNVETEVIELRAEVNELKQKLELVQDTMNSLLKFNPMAEKEVKTVYQKDNSLDNKNLSLVICRYKKSVLIKSKYPDKNTTKKCKEQLKEIEGKWNGTEQGWLFVGAAKEGKSMEENAKFIMEHLKDSGYEVEVEYT